MAQDRERVGVSIRVQTVMVEDMGMPVPLKGRRATKKRSEIAVIDRKANAQSHSKDSNGPPGGLPKPKTPRVPGDPIKR